MKKFFAMSAILLAMVVSAYAQYPSMVEGKTYSSGGIGVRFSKATFPGYVFMEISVDQRFSSTQMLAVGVSQGGYHQMTEAFVWFNPQTNTGQAIAIVPVQPAPVQYIKVSPIAPGGQGFRE